MEEKKVLERLQRQCAKAEYCSFDVRRKALKALEGDAEAAERVVEALVRDRFVDDARAFTTYELKPQMLCRRFRAGQVGIFRMGGCEDFLRYSFQGYCPGGDCRSRGGDRQGKIFSEAGESHRRQIQDSQGRSFGETQAFTLRLVERILIRRGFCRGRDGPVRRRLTLQIF